VRALRKDVNEKEVALQCLRQEKDEMISKHQQQEASLREEIDDLVKTVQVCFLAVNFAYQKTYQDCEIAKHRAQTLSDEGKETHKQLVILEKRRADEIHIMNEKCAELELMTRNQKDQLHKVRDERDKTRMEMEEKDRKITDLRKQRMHTDETYAKLLHRAFSHGVDLQMD
jgi:chromosome segregation ATPase